MEKIDTKLAVHVGAEILIIGGISVYFFKQIKDLQGKIDNLEKQNEFFKQAIETHDSYLREMYESGRLQKPRVPQLQRNPQQQRPRQEPQHRPQRPTHLRSQPEDDSEPDFADEELDAELETELQELEEDCDDNTCNLKNRKPSNKNAKR